MFGARFFLAQKGFSGPSRGFKKKYNNIKISISKSIIGGRNQIKSIF